MHRFRHAYSEGLEASARRRRLGSLVLTIFAALSCADGSRSTRPDESNPNSSRPFIAAVNGRVSPDPIVYISLPPGAIVGGKRAILNVQRTGSSTQTTLIDGGFDPVSLRALPGDVITIIVDLGAENGTVSYSIVVPKPSRPIVVRTKPPKQKRDVPLNAAMMVVFSEPIDAATLTDVAVQLTREGLPVKGRLEFANAEHLTAVFTPEAELEAGSDYTLVISQAIHDLDGSALDSAVSVPFTTVGPILPGTPKLPSFVFTVQPTTTQVGAFFNPMVEVSVVDSTGRVMPEYRGEWRIRLGNGTNATLNGLGNISVDAGVATFYNLNVNMAGVGYTLVAEGDGVTSATSDPFTVTELPPLGALEISVTTSGTGGPSGYFISVDNGVPTSIGVNASLTVRDLPQASHNVTLSGLGTNCMVTGEASVTAAVLPYQTTDVRFSVTCGVAGSIRVTTTTSGTDADPDGYTLGLNVAGLNSMASLPASGTTVANLARVGSSVIKLSGVAENCTVAGGAVRQVDVRAEEVALVSFDVTCGPVTQLAFVRGLHIFLVNSNGTGLIQLTQTEAGISSSYAPAWSPDGTRIAFARWKGEASEIYVMNADGTNVVQRTSTGRYNSHPTWSPDGRKIAFTAWVGGNIDVNVMSAVEDGTPVQHVTNRPGYNAEPAWSPDGRRILFVSDWRAFDFVRDLYAVDAADGANATVIAAGPFFWPNVVLLFQPASAPDGRIAVVECSSGYYDCETSTVAILNANGSNRIAISTGAFFSDPSWSLTGSTLSFTVTGCPSCSTSIRYVRADGSHEDTLIDNGAGAVWRPRP